MRILEVGRLRFGILSGQALQCGNVWPSWAIVCTLAADAWSIGEFLASFCQVSVKFLSLFYRQHAFFALTTGMAIHLAVSEQDVVYARWRPDHIISHLESPTYDAQTRRLTYAQVLGRVLPGTVQGVWCVKDVHIVDADVAELMAVLKASWARRRFHLILVSPSPDAALR